MDNSQTARILIALKQLKELMDISDEEFKKERRVWVIPSLAKRNPHSLEAHLLEGNMINIDDFEKILGFVSTISYCMYCLYPSPPYVASVVRTINSDDSSLSQFYFSKSEIIFKIVAMAEFLKFTRHI